jgi:hypothetical protein
LWNDTDRRKPKYWGRNISHPHTKIGLNIAWIFSLFRLQKKTNHLTLIREMVVACCDNH